MLCATFKDVSTACGAGVARHANETNGLRTPGFGVAVEDLPSRSGREIGNGGGVTTLQSLRQQNS